MWEDEISRERKIKLILIILIGAIVVALLCAMLIVKKKNASEDELLAQTQQLHQAEQSAAKEQEVGNIDLLYQQDLDAIATYMPGIVCWGDTLTTGTSGNVSYSYVLQKYIQANITDIYNFADSVPNASSYSYIDYTKYKVDIPVVNMGAGDENARTVMARAGVLPMVLKHAITIPAECEKVALSLISSDGGAVNPLVGGDGGINKVTIAGIEGTLSLENENYYSGGQYFFLRSEPGQETEAAEGSVITTASENLYKDYIHVIWIGTYGGYDSPTDLVNRIKTFVDRQEINKDRYIILGLCSDSVYHGSAETYDNLMKQEFGNNFISVWSYLMTDGITDAKLTLSATDQSAMQWGTIPSGFQGADSSELNGTAYKLIGKLVYDRMNSLGFFNEINDELYIKETQKILLKDNPQYLDNLLQSRLKEIGD